MRASTPHTQGHVDRDGVRVSYAVYGGDGPTVLLAPTWPAVDSRVWKAQVPHLARHFRVVTIDPRGHGRSDRPTDPAAYAEVDLAEDLVAVLDAVGVERAVTVGLCTGGWWSAIAAARHPDRFDGLVEFAPAVSPLGPPLPERAVYPFDEDPGHDEGWARYTAASWRRDWPGFLRFFFGQLVPEPYSTTVVEDCVAWGLETAPEVLLAVHHGRPYAPEPADTEAVLRAIRCPVLVVYGGNDRCQSWQRIGRFAELTRAEVITVEGGGHLLPARSPVAANQWITDFVRSVHPRQSSVDSPATPARQWRHPRDRPRRVLFLSSPIGLGHARRDLAIADALRDLRPGLRVDWLTQHPVTELLRVRGERIHPASAWLANESAHLESLAGPHDLHAFRAIRAMSEILVANYMVFDDLVRAEPYDAWIGDEAWELDHFLHENPERKRAPFVWLTDFVGWLPLPDGGADEAALTADHNAEMLDQRGRLPWVRDRSLFVGNPDDIVPDDFGPGLPTIREWTTRNYQFTGYVTGAAPVGPAERDRLRHELGYGGSGPVCVVTVGGSAVGTHLLRAVLAAHPVAARHLDGLRTVIVTGPRIDPASLPTVAGVEVYGFRPDLPSLLAACDLAIVHGGLTTTMELTAADRPFIYVPLRHHFEQLRHVRHRLGNYRAGRCLPYEEVDPERLAATMVQVLATPVDYRPVETDGARRAAALIADLLAP